MSDSEQDAKNRETIPAVQDVGSRWQSDFKNWQMELKQRDSLGPFKTEERVYWYTVASTRYLAAQADALESIAKSLAQLVEK